MNAKQRDRLDDALKSLRLAMITVEEVRDENQESYDNMPEGLQQSENGEKTNEAAEQLQEAYDNMENAEGCIESAKQ